MVGMTAKTIAESRISYSRWMGVSDANHLGFVHGGIIMKLIDEAGGIVAARHSQRSVVTANLDSLIFLRPIHLRDLVTLTAEITYVGRTSMETKVEVHAEEIISGESELKNIAYLVFVALDGETGKPTPVPPLRLENDSERIRAEEAKLRMDHRLEQRKLASLI
ncbi:MAG: acyl-CoA thioesterase [Anaerolineaceae bacterium]|nr:acyl-CoA thioesterase [Anaerolineaceae bacterium]MCY3936000.1 acyl-CoA thioesterase [Chloroflexota bacterium]MCY4105351.1 acyl-CoA thioesterase [Chloroflexota bacterium]